MPDPVRGNHYVEPLGRWRLRAEDGLETAEKVFFGEQEVSFQVDGEVLVVVVPRSRAQSR
jgi:hypothetical protein